MNRMKRANRLQEKREIEAHGAKAPMSAMETKAVGSSISITKIALSGGSIGSFDIFRWCIERATNLLKIHKAAHGKKAKPEKYLADAHRAAIVLSISALDAFIRSFVIARVRNLLANKGAILPDSLASRIKNFLKEDGLLEAARKDDLLDRVEKAFRDDFEKKSFQGTRHISESMKLVGYEDIFHEVAIGAGENEDTLRKRLNYYTMRRHAIAHHGDYDLNKNPPQENTIIKKEATECIKLVSLIAEHIDKLERVV